MSYTPKNVYVDTTGDAMDGYLTLSGDPTQALGASTVDYAVNRIVVGERDPQSPGDTQEVWFMTDASVAALTPALNFVARWTSTSKNTLTWTDINSHYVYDIYVSPSPATEGYRGALIASGITPGVQTFLHQKGPDPTTTLEDFEDTSYNFTFSGTWTRVNTKAYAGTWSWASPTTAHSGTSSSTFTATVPTGQVGTLSMQAWIESENNYDFFDVWVNGVRQYHNSGVKTAWESISIPLSAGANSVELRYYKDNAGIGGADKVWVDNLTLSVAPAPVVGEVSGFDVAYYTLIARNTSNPNLFNRATAAVPKTRDPELLPFTIGPGQPAVQGLMHVTAAAPTQTMWLNVSTTSPYNYVVDWGDGSSKQTFVSGNDAPHTYTYASMANQMTNGTRQAMWTVTPQGSTSVLTKVRLTSLSTMFPVELICSQTDAPVEIILGDPWEPPGEPEPKMAIVPYNLDTIKNVYFLGDVWLTGMAHMFQDMQGLLTVTGSFTGSGSATAMFSGCTKLGNPVLRATPNGITDFSYMFAGCWLISAMPDIDTSAGTNFSNMFYDDALTSFRSYNTSRGVNFSGMFGRNNVGSWVPPALDTGSGVDFSEMFYSSNTTQMTNYDTSNGTNFSNMFASCGQLTAAGFRTYNTAKGTDFSSMFADNSQLATLPALNTSNALALAGYARNTSITAMPDLNTSNCTDFGGMFSGCNALVTTRVYDTSKGTDFSFMFAYCDNASFVPPAIDTSKGTDFAGMFQGTVLTGMPNITTSSGTDFSEMFSDCRSLTTAGLRTYDTSKGTDFHNMFYGCDNANFTTVPAFNTSLGTDFSSMFGACSYLTTMPDIGTSNGLNFASMFEGCSRLVTTRVYNTANGTDFMSMFDSCTALVTAPALNTANGVDFWAMFVGCNALTSMPDLNTANGTRHGYMFASCYALTSAGTRSYSTGKSERLIAMFASCWNAALTTLPVMATAQAYDLAEAFRDCNNLTTVPAWDCSGSTDNYNMFGNCSKVTTINAFGFTTEVDISPCVLMNATAINNFFTNLGTANGAQTVNITGLAGAATCNRAIATAKGWTVTG